MSHPTVADPRDAVSTFAQGDETRSPRTAEHQLGILGGLEGTQIAWCEPRWLEAVASRLEEGEAAPLSEADELAAELQQALRWDGSRPAYRFPELAHLFSLEGLARRAYCEHPSHLEHVAEMTTAELAGRLEWLHLHRSRCLSPLDEAVQREWTARSLGFGHWYGAPEPQLPAQLVELAGRRAPVRRTVLAAVCRTICLGAVGMTISAPDAERLWQIPASTWWNVLAWLEQRGLIIRMHRYKNNRGRGPGVAPVQWCADWIGPGPELMKRARKIIAAFGGGTDDDRAEVHEELVSMRRQSAREQRRRARGDATTGAPSPAWVIVLGHVVLEDAARAAAADEAGERFAAILENGPGELGELLGRDPPTPRPPGPDVSSRLEELARLGDVPPAELRYAAEQIRAARVFVPPQLPSNEWTQSLRALASDKKARRERSPSAAAPSRAREGGDNQPRSSARADLVSVLRSTSTNHASAPAPSVAATLARGRPRAAPPPKIPDPLALAIERAAAALGHELEAPTPNPRGEAPP